MNPTTATPPTPYRPEPFKLRAGMPGPVLGVIAKNPSIPDDPSNSTFGGIIRYATANEFGEILVVNLFARRSPDPKGLNDLAYDDAVGPDNDQAILTWADSCDRLVCGWGNPNGVKTARYIRRIREVSRLLADRPLWSVGDPTVQGHPIHPSRNQWSPDAPLRPYGGTIQTWE